MPFPEARPDLHSDSAAPRPDHGARQHGLPCWRTGPCRTSSLRNGPPLIGTESPDDVSQCRLQASKAMTMFNCEMMRSVLNRFQICAHGQTTGDCNPRSSDIFRCMRIVWVANRMNDDLRRQKDIRNSSTLPHEIDNEACRRKRRERHEIKLTGVRPRFMVSLV